LFHAETCFFVEIIMTLDDVKNLIKACAEQMDARYG